jgi:hypothetical protein
LLCARQLEQHAGARGAEAEAGGDLPQCVVLGVVVATVGEGDEAAPAEQRVELGLLEAHRDARGEAGAVVDRKRLRLPVAQVGGLHRVGEAFEHEVPDRLPLRRGHRSVGGGYRRQQVVDAPR